jgi:SNF2 family DNA or RNA helicase
MEDQMSALLWKHQLEAIAYAMSRRDVLLHLGMGTGKTRIALEIIRQMIAAAPNGRFLVGCPKAVIAAWAKQSTAWLPDVRVLLLDRGTSKDKEKQVAAALADTTPVIIVGNYETLWRMPALEKTPWTALIWDEVHRLKSASGAASKWAAKMGKKNPSAKRIGLSGTLIAHSLLDCFGTWRAVESPECQTFGQLWSLFKANNFQPHPHIRGAVLGLRRDREVDFAKKIGDTTFHRRSEDVLDLPPLMFDDVPVELGPKEAGLYREVENEFCAVCEAGTITTANAMVAVLRLQQICGGYAKFDDAAAATKLEETPSKQAVLEERFADLASDEQPVVFCRFRTDIDSVLEAARRTGRTTSELSGRMNTLADWQAGRTNVLVAQIQSGGIGIDLTRARYGFFYSLGYSLSEYLQAVARLHRPGQTKTTHFYHLVATLPNNRKTVDGRVYEALSQRKEVIDAVIQCYRTSGNRPSAHAV